MRKTRTKNLQQLALVLSGLAAVLLILTLVLVVFRHRNDRNKAEDSVEQAVDQWKGSAGNQLWLVNDEYILSTTYEPENLTEIPGSSVKAVQEAAEAFSAMAAQMETPVVPANGYISAETQQKLYDDAYQDLLNQGYSKERAQFLMKGVYYNAGQDEHQLGYTIDVCEDDTYQLNENLLRTEQGKWLQENAWKYGFIIRNQGDTEAVYRPWQLRYVGRVHAQIMHEQGLSLESYLNMLQDKGVFYVTLENGVQYDLVLYCKDSLDGIDGQIKEVSGDNKGHYIITCYR